MLISKDEKKKVKEAPELIPFYDWRVCEPCIKSYVESDLIVGRQPNNYLFILNLGWEKFLVGEFKNGRWFDANHPEKDVTDLVDGWARLR